MTTDVMVLQCVTNKIHICADIQFIEKVILMPLIEAMPGTPCFIAGQMNVAGISVPVLDLTLYLDLPRKKTYSLDTPILLCKYQSLHAGIIVDELLSLDEISLNNIQMTEEFEGSPAFKASLLIKGKLALLLNIPKILQSSVTLNKLTEN